MQNESTTVEQIPFGELSQLEQLFFMGGGILAVLWFAGIIWLVWASIRAQLDVPKQLAGVKQALERSADRLERDSR